MAHVQRVSRFVLSPHIRLVVEEQPQAVSSAVGFFVGCGSRHENKAFHGLTHLAEHLFFKGTTKRNAEEISIALERYGGELNAYTDRECTTFHAWVPAQRLSEALTLLTEMVFDSVFDREEFEREREVVVQELSGYEDSPDDEFQDASLEVPWGNHSLGRRIGGFAAQLRHARHSQLISHVQNNFLRAPMVLSVVSPFPADKVRRLAMMALRDAEDFTWGAQLKGRGKKLQFTAPNLPTPWAARSQVKRFDSDQVQLGFFYPAVRIEDPHEVVWSALGILLGGGASSKLYRVVRERAGLAYAIQAQLHAFSDSGLLGGFFATSPKNLLKATQLSAQVCRDLAAGVSAEDVDFVRGLLEGSIYMSFEGVNTRMEALGRQELFLGKPISLNQALLELRKVKQQSLNTAAKVLRKTPCIFALGKLRQSQLRALLRAWQNPTA